MSLKMILSTDSAQWKQGMKSAESDVSSLVSKATSQFKTLAGAAAGIFGVSMAKDQLLEWIDGLSKIGHEAARIGITTDELQRLKSVATKNKIDPDTMIGGIEKMATIVDDALQGSDQAIEKFKRMGIAMSELKDKSVYEQFSRIADGIQSMGTASEKTALARDMFGKLGGKLVELTGNFRELGDAFDKSGRMIDDKTIQQAEQFDLTMKSLGGTFKATFLQSGVVEYLEEMSAGFKKAADMSKQIDNVKVKGRYGNKVSNTVDQFNEHTGYGPLLRMLGLGETGEVLRLDAPSKDEVIGKRNKRLMDAGKKEEQAASAAEQKKSYEDKDYNKAIASLQQEVSLQSGIADGKKSIAEAQKIINSLEEKGKKLTFEQIGNIFALTAAKQAALDKTKELEEQERRNKAVKESFIDKTADLQYKLLKDSGQSLEAEKEKLRQEFEQKKGGKLDSTELARVDALAMITDKLNNAPSPQKLEGEYSNSLARIGGFSSSVAMPDKDRINQSILTEAKKHNQLLDQVNKIIQQLQGN